MLADETYRLVHLVCGEASLDGTQVELYDEAPGNGIAVEYGLTLQCEALEGVTCGVPQVEGLADALFRWVLSHDALLHGHAVSKQLLELRTEK